MCPPASSIPPADELNGYSADEIVFKLLMQLKNGCSLPLNVLADVDPYRYTPSNLPADMFYFWSGTKTDGENGFWKSTGDAREIYSTPLIIGLRKTFKFYEGRAPDGQKTNWIMQEYTTTEKCNSKPDSRALYKVFLVDDASSGRVSESELLEKNMDGLAGPSAMATPSRDISIGDYVSRGDYLELDDLIIPLSRTTSCADSSCMTMSMTSEDFFDTDALMRELEDDIVDQESQHSKIKLNISVPAKLKEVVLHPTALGSLESHEDSKPGTGQTSKTDPTPQREPEAGWSNRVNSSASSSSSSEGSSKDEKKERTKKHKMMKYLCFLAF